MADVSKSNSFVVAKRRAGIFSILVLILTTIHHVYGAIAYQTPWRFHVAAIALPLALVIYFGLRAGRSAYQAGKGPAIIYWIAALILLVPVSAVGIFEGGYNHLLKNFLYFGWGAHAMQQLFPAPLYELPTDRFFEGTGIAQLPLGLAAAFWTILMLLRLRKAARAHDARTSHRQASPLHET